MKNTSTNRRSGVRAQLGRHRRRRIGSAFAVALLLALGASSGVAGGSHGTAPVQWNDVLGQGDEGIYHHRGALLVRHAQSFEVIWNVPTPEPGSYLYPDPTQVPPGAPEHPEILVGDPEVFTLWGFVFNHPELCSDPCNGDDIGDTPAAGGVYRLAGRIAHGDRIVFHARVAVDQAPAAGAALSEPATADIHVAMAPHGQALEGDALQRQLGGAVGSPANWWPAIFLAP